MPKISDERRTERKHQIASAAFRCFQRNGLERTSIADITAEAGLSAGAIYVHYKNKAELAQHVAGAVLEQRVAEVADYVEREVPPSPAEFVRIMVEATPPDEAAFIIQLWGEAATDPAMREVVTTMATGMTALIRDCTAAWLTKVKGLAAGEAREAADAMAPTLAATCQGFLLRRAILEEPGKPRLADVLAHATDPTPARTDRVHQEEQR